MGRLRGCQGDLLYFFNHNSTGVTFGVTLVKKQNSKLNKIWIKRIISPKNNVVEQYRKNPRSMMSQLKMHMFFDWITSWNSDVFTKFPVELWIHCIRIRSATTESHWGSHSPRLMKGVLTKYTLLCIVARSRVYAYAQQHSSRHQTTIVHCTP